MEYKDCPHFLLVQYAGVLAIPIGSEGQHVNQIFANPPGDGQCKTNCRLQTADCGLRTADCGLRTADCGLRTADCGLRTADCGLRTADCGLRTADCGLRTADCRLQTGGEMQTEGKMQTADCRPGVKLQTEGHKDKNIRKECSYP